MLCAAVALPVISLWATYQIRELSDRVTTVDAARLDMSRTLRYALDEESGLRGYMATRVPLFLRPYYAADPKLQKLVAQLPGRFSRAGLYGVLPQLNDFRHLHDAWRANVAAPLLADPRRLDALALQEAGKNQVDRMRVDARAIQDKAAAHVADASKRMFGVMVVAGMLAMAWILIVGGLTLLSEREVLRRETALVVSLVEERDAVGRLSDWRSRLLAMLAHDFKSQLAVIVGTAHLLEDFPQRRADPDVLASLRGAAYSLAEMADDAILLAGAQEQRLMLQQSIFDVCRLVDAAVERYGTEHRFYLHTQSGVAFVEADRSYAMRALDNVVGNAVKYSDGDIDVHVAEEQHYVRVSVTDRGEGISQTDLPHVFEEFWRSGDVARDSEGTGVGLFIVKQIMEAHGGTVRVESRVNEGTTVTLRFPRADRILAAGPADELKTAT